MTTQTSRRLVVALHGIEPATFEHCALIREWLGDLGVERVTLCLAAPPRRAAAHRRPATLPSPGARLGADVPGVLGAP